MENKNTQTTLLIGRDNNDGTVVYVSTKPPKLVGPDGGAATKDNIEQCTIEFDQGSKVDAIKFSGVTVMSDDEAFWSMKIKDHTILPYNGGEFKAVFKLPNGDDVSNYGGVDNIACYAHIEKEDGSYETIKCDNVASDNNNELAYVFAVDEWKKTIESWRLNECIERLYGKDLTEQERKVIYDKLYDSVTERTIAFDLIWESINRHPIKLHSSSVKQKSSITEPPDVPQPAKYITLISGEGFIFE